MTSTKVAFVVPSCSHYRVKTYELLAERWPQMKFYFFSRGDEWYVMRELGARAGNFPHEYLRSIKMGRWYITPSLVSRIWNYDIYISGISGRFSLPLVYATARLRRKPFILWLGIWHRIQTPFQRLFFPATRHIYRNADAIVTYGTHVEEYLISEGVKPERIFSAKHAIDNEVYARSVSSEELSTLRQRYNISDTHKVLLYVGRLVPEKGLDYLIEAFIQIARSDVILMLVGTGDYEVKLRARLQEHNAINRARFVGYIPPEELPPFYALADVFVLPSITTPQFKEPWGLVVNEAFNQGKPVIATNAVGAAMGGLVQHGINGFIVPERDSAALAKHILLLLDDPQKCVAFGAAGRQRVSLWSNEAMIQAFSNAIEFVHKK